MGQILNSHFETCVCWPLSLKCQACQIDSKQFLLIAWVKNGCGNCGVSWQVVFCIFLSELSHQNYWSQKLSHFFRCDTGPRQGCGRDFPFLCILTMVKVRYPVSNRIRLSPVTELMIQQQSQSFWVINYYIQTCGSKEKLIPSFFISHLFYHQSSLVHYFLPLL